MSDLEGSRRGILAAIVGAAGATVSTSSDISATTRSLASDGSTDGPDSSRGPIVLDARGGGQSDVQNLRDALAEMIGSGRSLELRPGIAFRVNDTLDIDLNPDSSDRYRGVRRITGANALLRGAGGVPYLLKARKGFTPYGVVIEDLVFDAENNADLDTGLILENTAHVTLSRLTFPVGGTKRDYDAIRLQNGPNLRRQGYTDEDYGTFWTLIDDCRFRPIDGGQSPPRACIHLTGAANATTIQRCSMSGFDVGVLADTPTPAGSLANGIDISHCRFEGLHDSCVKIVNVPGKPTATGWRFDGNRVEQYGRSPRVVRLLGTTIAAGRPFIVGPANDVSPGADGKITLVEDPNGVGYVSWAAHITPGLSPTLHSRAGMTSSSIEGDAFTARAGNVGMGYALARHDGTVLGSWRFRASHGSVLRGDIKGTHPIHGVYFQGSTSGVEVRQVVTRLRFTGQTRRAVTFPYYPEEDADYAVNLMFRDRPPNRWWVGDVTTKGFTINFDEPFEGTVFWEVRR